ncbi:armadillo-type protein [Flagelloscypha sp. PMI_526]|nr:armadillo-type protein [Flagelloscypha sp. PMI_526]
MEQDISQVVQAIEVASDPSQGALHQQALSFLSTVQQNSHTTWRLALSLFLDVNPDGSRRYSNDARFYALRIIDDFLDNRFEPFDDETFQFLQQTLVNYIQTEYVFGSAEASTPFLRNKFSHTLTLFFLCVYIDKWPTFFPDLINFIQPTTPDEPYNTHLCMLFFHVILEISGEVADQIIKSARQFNKERVDRDAKVRDLVRERDAARINEAVLAIVGQVRERMNKGEPDANKVVETVELGVKTYASYVGWIDINLTITPTTVPLLFGMLAESSLPIRLATCAALNRVVGKGLQAPEDKLKLLKVLSLNEVLDTLETKTREQQIARGDIEDEGEESFRESLGRLLTVLGLEWNKLADDSTAPDAIRAEANAYQTGLLPTLLRFMADPWDDTASTVFPFLSVILTGYKRLRKASPAPLDDTKRQFLLSLLQVLLNKMKWREDADTMDDDDEEHQEFEGMRKELRTFLEHVLILDVDMVTTAIHTLTMNTFGTIKNGQSIPWTDAELAIYLLWVFGEVNKQAPKGRGAFCIAPPVEKEKRKTTDYSQFPLTPFGDMLMALVQSGIVNFQHSAVALMFFEVAARYPDFWKIRKECILPTLEAFIDTRGVHRPEDASFYKSRIYYLFWRFIESCHNDIPPEICEPLVNSIRDLLPIHIIPKQPNDHDSNSTIDDPLLELTVDPTFESQLYLFQAVGTACSLVFRNPEQHSSLLLSVYKPLLTDLEDSLGKYTKNPASGDLIVIAKVHHVIMALGNVAKGFPDLPNPLPTEYILPPIDVFTQVAQAILVCLEHMKTQKVIRDATRFAFARILATTGSNVTHFVPALMGNLLSHFEPSELVDFINFISMLIHKLQMDLFNVVDELIGPLSQHIMQVLSQPVSGTDAQRAHTETKRTYLSFLNNIMTSKLQGVFLTERNNGNLESFLDAVQRIGQDTSDAQASRSAFLFLERTILAWGNVGEAVEGGQELPGFDRVIYERIVPTAFSVPNSPDLNIKDGGVMTVLHEIANIFNSLYKARGDEAIQFFLTVYLPSQNWPQEAAVQFTNNLRDLDVKSFRKYFAEFVRSTRSATS